MGNSALSKKQLSDLQGLTKNKLTKQGIKDYHRYWYELFPSGDADKHDFLKYAEDVFQNVEETNTDYLFRAMDSNKDGKVTFQEFLIFQAITSPTTDAIDPFDMIEVCFNMYDKDNDGFLTISELFETLTNIVKANGKDVTNPDVKKQIAARVHKLVKACDADGDGHLTLEEVRKACEKDPSITDLF